MKKILGMLLSLCLLMTCTSGIIAEPSPVTLTGEISELTDTGFLFAATDSVTYEVLIQDDTLLDISRSLMVGDFVTVDYSGKTTRSIPPQINAQRIVMATIDGFVVQEEEDGSLLIQSEELGQVLVKLDDGVRYDSKKGDWIYAYYDGTVSASLPAQITAQKLRECFAVTGTMSREDADESTFNLITDEDETIIVNFSADTVMPEDLPESAYICVYYNGMETRSIPAGIHADVIKETARLAGIMVHGNASTGYSWSYCVADPSVCAFAYDEYTPDNADPTLAGGGGTFNYYFRAVGEGATSISMKYARVWEDDAATDPNAIELVYNCTVTADGTIVLELQPEE